MIETSKTAQADDTMRETYDRRPLVESPRFASSSLFASSSEIRIDHNGATYTLRITRSGGLLLNK